MLSNIYFLLSSAPLSYHVFLNPKDYVNYIKHRSVPILDLLNTRRFARRSFDLDLVTANYEEQTRRATVTPRNGARSSLPPLRLVLPPPNVTGRLHIGHALTVTIEDAIARHHRAKWLPGMDHAGIATQSVVERELWRKEKKTRRDMGREEFLRRCSEFADQNATVIRDQMARMGATLQWKSEYYTLDKNFSAAVTRAFVALHRQGLISRDKRFVHWSPALRSSISDQEVDKVELPPGGVISLPSPDGKGRREVKLGVMHTVNYQLIGGGKDSFVPVATTRPETIYADIALAIHPSHPRAGELRGRRARNPLDGRDKRFVHWSPTLRSSISDQEVDKVELPPGGVISLPSPDGKGRREVKLGVMHTVNYELIGGGMGSFVPVATTRPETIYADIALAIHPSHPRASELRGRRARNPLDGRELPIVVDEAVVADKGTGILKITPAHDRLDAEIASRHWAEIEEVDKEARTRSCIDSYGRLIGGTPLDGIDRFDARTTVLSQLQSLGALVKSKEAVTTAVSLCSRTGDIIEPRQTHQWFLDCRHMHAEAAMALRDGRLSILPPSQGERLLDWFNYAEPWCLSRQLVWGHRIPAWNVEGTSKWIVENSAKDAREGRGEGVKLIRDPDVLDTWFSSGLVPLVCGGWMNQPIPHFPSPPLSLMETGTDILGFWVARMVALTMRLSGGQVPFPRVILHGMVRDAEGRKMSKSIGNVVDPLDVIDGISLQKMEERLGESALSEKEKATALSSLRSRFPSGIPRCGADSLRFALLRHDVLAADVPIDIGTLASEGLRFCNKLWNLAAYAAEVRGRVEKELVEGEKGEEHVMDSWLRSRLASSLQSVDSHMEETAIHLAFADIHSFVLTSLSDVYVESTKSLRQLSVFMPFVSHFLYDQITSHSVYDTPLNYSASWIDQSLENTVTEVLAVAAAARSLKQQLGVPNKTKFQGELHSSLIPPALSPLLPLLSHLCAVSIDTVLPLDEPSPVTYESTPVPGQNARLALKVEESHREEMRKVLEEKLKKAVEKKVLYLQKAARYEEIAREERSRGSKRERSAAKNDKKSEQARAVASSAEKEEERIRAMI